MIIVLPFYFEVVVFIMCWFERMNKQKKTRHIIEFANYCFCSGIFKSSEFWCFDDSVLKEELLDLIELNRPSERELQDVLQTLGFLIIKKIK